MRQHKTNTWHRTASLSCLAAWPLAWAGCGGGLTQEDMMRHAIRRPSDDDEEVVVAQAKKQPEPQEKQAQQDTTAAKPPAPPPPQLQSGADRSGPGTAKSAAATPAQSVAAAQHATPPSDTAPNGSASTSTANASGEVAASPAPPGPPPQPLSLTQRRQRTIDNLTRIGAAIRQYCETNGKLFGPAILNTKGQPMLSWRVELLPYLGYQELYEKFDPSEPWDSPRNLPFLELIPNALSIAGAAGQQDQLPGPRRHLLRVFAPSRDWRAESRRRTGKHGRVARGR